MGTVFVITDSAFETMSDNENAVDITQAEFKKRLLRFLTVPGRLDDHAIRKAIEKGKGTASFASLSGENLKAKLDGDTIVVFDSWNNSARVIASNFYHKQGFFHIVDGLIFSTEE